MEINQTMIEKYKVRNETDIGLCRRKAVGFARELGFQDVNSGEIAIIVTELGTNIIKHGGSDGLFLFYEMESRKGIEIWCFDSGNGFSDIQKESADGYSSKDTLGIGLGAIKRLSDDFVLKPELPDYVIQKLQDRQHNYSNIILCRKWIPEQTPEIRNKNLETGLFSRQKVGEQFNGDSYVVAHLDHNTTIIAVIDGLGHGKEAHIASSLAKEHILLNKEQPIDLIIKNVHIALKSTRGVVIGICKIDTASEKLLFSGIGNIEGQVFGPGDQRRSFVSFGGIVGHNIRTPGLFEFEFKKGYTLSMYSDGIQSRWQQGEIDWSKHPQSIALHAVNAYSRINDDATILIIRYTS